jgi:hypothetical protein
MQAEHSLMQNWLQDASILTTNHTPAPTNTTGTD